MRTATCTLIAAVFGATILSVAAVAHAQPCRVPARDLERSREVHASEDEGREPLPRRGTDRQDHGSVSRREDHERRRQSAGEARERHRQEVRRCGPGLRLGQRRDAGVDRLERRHLSELRERRLYQLHQPLRRRRRRVSPASATPRSIRRSASTTTTSRRPRIRRWGAASARSGGAPSRPIRPRTKRGRSVTTRVSRAAVAVPVRIPRPTR